MTSARAGARTVKGLDSSSNGIAVVGSNPTRRNRVLFFNVETMYSITLKGTLGVEARSGETISRDLKKFEKSCLLLVVPELKQRWLRKRVKWTL